MYTPVYSWLDYFAVEVECFRAMGVKAMEPRAMLRVALFSRDISKEHVLTRCAIGGTKMRLLRCPRVFQYGQLAPPEGKICEIGLCVG